MRGRSVSPQRTATRSIGTPSSSAAIWAQHGLRAAADVVHVALDHGAAVGARRTRAAPGKRKLPIEQVAIPCPIRHVPVLPRALVAVAPAVAAGALRVGLAQPVARPRPAVRGRHLGEVGQPQVERVDADLVGELVHRALERPQPRPLDRGAHRRRHVEWTRSICWRSRIAGEA